MPDKAKDRIFRQGHAGGFMAAVLTKRPLVLGLLSAALLSAGATECPQANADTIHKSGYALTEMKCGQAPDAYPKLRIGMRDGYCAGLVASEEDGLRFPRSILQIPSHRQFVIADMGSWKPGEGRLLLLDPDAAEGRRISELMVELDFPFGLQAGPDGKVYASTSEEIFRFDPLAANPKNTVETIIRNLPGLKVTLSDGTAIDESVHPLKPFIFDKTGRIFVSVGAPTDNCLKPFSTPCAAGEGAAPLAAIWLFTPPPGGIFPALGPADINPHREIFARGLRNSMALALHPEFPAEGFAFLQGENGRDLLDPLEPNEELNSIEPGKHYGWPYCYDLATPSPEFKSFLQSDPHYRNFCANAVLYRQPYSLLPPHAAPLGMFYYSGNRFRELQGKLVVGLHGYRPTGSRIIFYDVDARGFPKISPPPVRYHLSCAADPSRTFQTEQKSEVAAASFVELVSEWHKVNGIRPRGAPVGMTLAADGAIWLVEDHNKTIIRIDTDTSPTQDMLPCDIRSPQAIDELAGFVRSDRSQSLRLTMIRTGLIEKHCGSCHQGFGLKPALAEKQKDETVLRFLLSEDGWIFPGDPASSRLHVRLNGIGAERVMPPGPPDGRDLIAHEKGYKALLAAVDLLVTKMVPGQRMRIKGGRIDRKLFDRAGHECGAIPGNMVAVVVDINPKEKPSFSRIFRPADLYLNGECTDANGYYIEQDNLVAL
jgi:glucose/arabinose dehydrogenase